MTLHPDDTVLRAWAADLVPEVTGRAGDWLCTTVATRAGELCAEYRFRYHTGASPAFDSGDEINRYSMRCGPDSPESRAKLFGVIAAMLASGGFRHIQEVEINGTPQAFFAALLDMPGWATRVTRLDTKPDPTKQ